jgi:hypothetical protein
MEVWGRDRDLAASDNFRAMIRHQSHRYCRLEATAHDFQYAPAEGLWCVLARSDRRGHSQEYVNMIAIEIYVNGKRQCLAGAVELTTLSVALFLKGRADPSDCHW